MKFGSATLKIAGTVITGLFCLLIVLFVLTAWHEERIQTGSQVNVETEIIPFPVSVDVLGKTIVENPDVEWFVEEHLNLAIDTRRQQKQLDKIYATLSRFGLYQQLASPVSRTLVIYAGERKEEVVKNFQSILKWSDIEAADFERFITDTRPSLSEGKFFPGRYVVPKDASPETVAILVLEKFYEEIVSRYPASVATQVPLETTLIIASLLEREAYDFVDMRVISGIIWNRLFIDMPLQLDASLQYARGSLVTEPEWWPKVVPADKYIDSPFNTYEVSGLPPAPIANPSLEAVIAALNPKETTCLFYFHHTDGSFYCSDDYETHVRKLTDLYGQGR